MTPLIEYYKTLTPKKQKQLCRHYYHYVEWISPSIPHHVRRPPYCGMGVKPPDIFCIPVDYRTHQKIHSGEIDRDEEWQMLEEIHQEYFELYIEIKLAEIEK